MSTPDSYDTPQSINYIGFNQDSKIISVGHKDGFMFYKTADVIENSILECRSQSLKDLNLNNCNIIERLFTSSLMVVVSQRDLRVLHVTSNHIICDHRFNKSILSVRLNKMRIVVCLEDCIYIYNLNDMKMLHMIVDTPMNKLGVVDMTINAGNTFLAYPGSTDTGSVHLFDAINLSSVNTFVAHEGTLACLKFNQDGNMLATASTKGTVIRVYSVPDGHRLFEFRRGVSRFVTIHSLCFSSDSKFLASSSNTETVHVFKLEKSGEDDSKPEAPTNFAETAAGWFNTINQAVSAYMPSQFTQVSELMTTERSFATAKLPCAIGSNRVALVEHKNHQFLLVATFDGYVYAYRMHPEGGELDLIKQHGIGPKTRNVPNLDNQSDFQPMLHTSG
ncbi:hypothetical protein CRE_23603 [Caenorhabditis remanei]|uniref:Uncharacterized protein n=1 Tax=Caenorhabditis remanei TaxID=31234 RepID=E3MVS0_CAERE|nr:hypothetical protein CRE_23603 [Caenorhabditis remanei]